MGRIKLDSRFYVYENGRYVRERLAEPKKCKTYRLKEVKPGRKVLLCVKGKKTKAVSLLRSLKVRKVKDKKAAKALKKAKKLLKKKRK